MNIFVLDYNVEKCAQYHCDKHVVKMILESCQMLSTAHRVLDGVRTQLKHPESGKHFNALLLPDEDYEYTSDWDSKKQQYRHSFCYDSNMLKHTHVNHPCNVWVRMSDSNYMWLWRLTVALCHEYTHRYNKIHTYERDGTIKALKQLPTNIPRRALKPFAKAMPEQYKVSGAVQSYRNYYLGEKQAILKYKNSEIPKFVIEYNQQH